MAEPSVEECIVHGLAVGEQDDPQESSFRFGLAHRADTAR
jgi:hypothetical protein